MKKQTIKQLQEELSLTKQERDNFLKLLNELDEERRRKDNNSMGALKEENEELKYQVKNLLEVIRWQINPETAKSPFKASKDQRDDSYRKY